MNAAYQSIIRRSTAFVQRYAPELEKRSRPHLRPTNDSYRVDETYVKIKGKWYYLYRAVDSTGQAIDFKLSAKRDARTAKRFFRKMLKASKHQSPRVITESDPFEVSDAILFAMNKEAVEMVVGPAKGGL